MGIPQQARRREFAAAPRALYGSRSTVQETNLDELSAAKVQATLGLQWRRNGHVIRLGFTDNVANFDNTPDVGLSLSFAQVYE